MIGLRLHTAWTLRKVGRTLRKIHDEPDPAPDLDEARQWIRDIIPTLPTDRAAAELVAILDTYIDSYVEQWSRELHGPRQDATTRQLDVLGARVAGVLARYGVLDTEDSGKHAESTGLATHIWDRVSEPDVPHTDPLRRPEERP